MAVTSTTSTRVGSTLNTASRNTPSIPWCRGRSPATARRSGDRDESAATGGADGGRSAMRPAARCAVARPQTPRRAIPRTRGGNAQQAVADDQRHRHRQNPAHLRRQRVHRPAIDHRHHHRRALGDQQEGERHRHPHPRGKTVPGPQIRQQRADCLQRGPLGDRAPAKSGKAAGRETSSHSPHVAPGPVLQRSRWRRAAYRLCGRNGHPLHPPCRSLQQRRAPR